MSNLKEHFESAEEYRARFLHTGSQEILEKAIISYEIVQDLARQVALFSNNESLEDVVSSELRYFLTDYHLANLVQQRHDIDNRPQLLDQSYAYYKSFLRLCDNYGTVPEEDVYTVETYMVKDSGSGLQAAAKVSASKTREDKILRYQKEKKLQHNLTLLSKFDGLDEDRIRAIGLATIHLAISKSLRELESIQMELEVLKSRQASSVSIIQPQDNLERSRSTAESWRLERSDSEVLDRAGKVLRPFVITSKRDSLRRKVYGPDHSLPTMSVDEYLEIERGRGGIIGPDQTGNIGQSDVLQTNEDDENLDEVARKKAIEWDSFTEENSKGVGNTMNRG